MKSFQKHGKTDFSKCFITGVNGFVGRHLKFLIKDAVGIDKTKSEFVDFEVDITNKSAMDKVIKKTTPDLIYHLAAQSSVKLSLDNPELTHKINVDGTQNLLDSVSKFSPDSKILIVSSSDVYGIPKHLPISEKDKVNPLSPYAKSKLEQEKIALKSGLNVIIARSFPHTGPGQSPVFVCSDFAKQISENKIIKTGDISVKRDFTDVRDIVKAYQTAMEKCNVKEIYNVCSSISVSIKQILDILIKISNKEITVQQDPNKLRKHDIPELVGDNSKFTKLTGWKPMISLEHTLRDLLEYWQNI